MSDTEIAKNYNFEVDTVKEKEWSDLLGLFEDANIYQTWAYGKVRWGERNLSHIILKKNQEVVSIAQLRIFRPPFFKSGMAYLTWGPVFRRRGESSDLAHGIEMVKALYQEYVVSLRMFLRVKSHAINDAYNRIFSAFNELGFRSNGEASSYRTLMVDLSPSEAEIRKRFAQKWRNQLNRAEKNDLQVIEGSNVDLYDTFISLFEEMLSRKKFKPGVDIHQFREIQEQLENPLKMIIFLCHHNGKAVSSLVGSAIGTRGIYLLGATNSDGMLNKASYLLQWRMIRWLNEQGCKWYDLGGINPEINPGVYHFKAGLGGTESFHIAQLDAYGDLSSRLFGKCSDLILKIKGK